MAKEVLFPVWQVDQEEYQSICAYLGISPNPLLYKKLSDYLAVAPFRFPRPQGFSLYLASPRLTGFRIARLDLASKLFFPGHPIRHILNAVIALHECDGKGYSQMAAIPSGSGLLLPLLGWALGFGASLLITISWISAHFLLFVTSAPFRSREDLAGKRILITGVNRGLGWDLMLLALQQGAEVLGTVRNEQTLNALASLLPEEAPVQCLMADLSQTGALVRALENAQVSPESLDMAILCAGVKHSNASVVTMPTLRSTFEVNFFSNVDLAGWLCRAHHEVTLVLVSSIGRWHGMQSSCGYNASKAALSIWGESLEMELLLSGNNRCNIMIVEPGIFESGMMKRKGINKFLSTSRRNLARRVLSGALAGKKVLRIPFAFTLLTWAVCLGGRSLRYRLFSGIKE